MPPRLDSFAARARRHARSSVRPGLSPRSRGVPAVVPVKLDPMRRTHLDGRRLRGCLGTTALDFDMGEPLEPAGEVPTPAVEQGERARKNDRSDHGRIEEKSDRDTEAHLLEHDELTAGEAREDDDDDERRPGDDAGCGGDARDDRLARRADLVVALANPAHEEHLVVHGEREEHREEEEWHPGVDRRHMLEAEEAGADAVQEYEGDRK